MEDGTTRRLILTEKWMAEKTATIYEVTFPNGKVKFNLQIRDKNRIKPYVNQMFSKPGQAEDFLYNKMIAGGTE